jgi:hypothetical protein
LAEKHFERRRVEVVSFAFDMATRSYIAAIVINGFTGPHSHYLITDRIAETELMRGPERMKEAVESAMKRIDLSLSSLAP